MTSRPELVDEPCLYEMLRSGTTPKASPGRVVRDEKELDIHRNADAGLRSGGKIPFLGD
jgi:hypothetical protein